MQSPGRTARHNTVTVEIKELKNQKVPRPADDMSRLMMMHKKALPKFYQKGIRESNSHLTSPTTARRDSTDYLCQTVISREKKSEPHRYEFYAPESKLSYVQYANNSENRQTQNVSVSDHSKILFEKQSKMLEQSRIVSSELRP